METHYRALQELEIDDESSSEIVVPVLLDKIPEEVRLSMTRGSKRKHQEWTIKEMLHLLNANVNITSQFVTKRILVQP